MIDFWDDEVIKRTCAFVHQLGTGKNLHDHPTEPALLINDYLKSMHRYQKKLETS